MRAWLQRLAVGREDGNVVVEYAALIVPTVLILMTGFQFAVTTQAQTCVQSAAVVAARSAAVEEGNTARAEEAAREVLARSWPVTGAEVIINRTPTTVTVVVEGQSRNLVPGLQFPVHKTVTMPVERRTKR